VEKKQFILLCRCRPMGYSIRYSTLEAYIKEPEELSLEVV